MTASLNRLVRPAFDPDDYRLIGGAGERARAAGLVNASWARCEVPRDAMKALTVREDGRALRDTLLWYGLLGLAGAGFWWAWQAGVSGLVAFALYFLYATLYAGPADSRWHECSHGTAFKTRWMNEALYQVASFQVLRRPTRWRWSHARHHTDTLITGRDAEIAVPVPTPVARVLLNVFAVFNGPYELGQAVINAFGRIDSEEKTYIPDSEWPAMVREARVWLLGHAAIVAAAVTSGSVLPLLLLGMLPGMLGSWLYAFFGFTQHAGLPENVTDHRLNCRTVYMNPVFRFLYWNMNYHVEHHMFPLVPYHALPRLHELIKADCPPPYAGTWAAYAELLPAVWRQRREPQYHVQRTLPRPPAPAPLAEQPVVWTPRPAPTSDWVTVGAWDVLDDEEVMRFDHEGRSYAIYRSGDEVFATDGLCTHEQVHLADGLVSGHVIECPKHNGRFDIRDGQALGAPVCVALKTYPARLEDGQIQIDISSAAGSS